MKFEAFLERARDKTWWQDKPLICFCTATEYPLIFFTLLFEKMRSTIGVVRTLDLIDSEGVESLRATCESSFLGTKGFYWFKDIGALDAKRRTNWFSYIRQYYGPNCLIFCASPTAGKMAKHALQIALPELSSTREMQICLTWLGIEDRRMQSLITTEIRKRLKKVPLDTISLLVRYVLLLEENDTRVLLQLFDQLLNTEKSLFALSGSLLAGNGQSFFRTWRLVVYDYPAIFWISYWSDFFWRAYYFVHFMQGGNNFTAKKFAVKLPFSFLQRDWRFANMPVLKQAIVSLYDIDRDLKNGSSAGYAAIEVTIMQFFMNDLLSHSSYDEQNHCKKRVGFTQ